jgi:hypothetical protein
MAVNGGGSATAGDAAAPAAPARAAGTQCLAQAQAAGSGAGSLVFSATLRWQGEDAVVLVFARPDQAKLSRRAIVMAQRDCRLLVAQSF